MTIALTKDVEAFVEDQVRVFELDQIKVLP